VNGVPKKISELGEIEPSPLELKPAERQIQVDYFALGSSASDNIRYQYRLDGQDWSEPIAQRTVNLDLAPGKRNLSIRAVDASGVRSTTPASLFVHILPPVWQRWWFVTFAATTVALSFALFYRYRVARLREVNAALTEARLAEEALSGLREDRLRELERVRARIATDLHDDIGSSLTQITVLSEVANQYTRGLGENASQPIARIISISNELVETMSDIVWAINPRKDHLADLLQRMRRFASDVLTARQITFSFITPDGFSDLALGASIRREVFLIFKETINNVVRHSGCSHADVELRIANQRLELTVRDDGQGFEAARLGSTEMPETRGGNGVPNMQKRAKELGGSFEISSSPGQGTLVTLRVSLLGKP
jgi:signal transduction histidine kinase